LSAGVEPAENSEVLYNEETPMRKTKGFLFVVLGAAVMLAGCSKQPAQEMQAAHAAVNRVMAEGAEQFTPEDARRLREQENAARAEVKHQDSRFIKRYGKARDQLVEVVRYAAQLEPVLAAKKEEARMYAQAALTAAEQALAAKRGQSDDALAEVHALMKAQDYSAARDKANTIRDRAEASHVAKAPAHAPSKKRYVARAEKKRKRRV
jgi:CHASE3 domain sensor protein